MKEPSNENTVKTDSYKGNMQKRWWETPWEKSEFKPITTSDNTTAGDELLINKGRYEYTQGIEKNICNIDVNYDEVKADHYRKFPIETIELMRRDWGNESTAKWCEMTAFKYRMRLGHKPTADIQSDIKKEEWYLKKA